MEQNQTTYDIHIKNYQIITDIHLQLKQGLTLITGKSNHGKSSLLKAIQSLLYNPSGTTFITHSKPHTQITLTHKDQNNNTLYQIQYTKTTQGTTTYQTQDPTTGTNTYSKIGQNQPQFIKDLTHISKDLNYNFWNQMDKPFLLSHTPREQFDLLQQSPHTQHLNQIQQQMVYDRKEAQQLLQNTQSQLDLITTQNQQYEQQLSTKPQIDILYTTLQELTHSKESLSQLQQILQQLQQIDTTPLQTTISTLTTIPSTTTPTHTLQTLNQVKHLYDQLNNTVYPINQLQQTLLNTDTQLQRTTLFITTQFTTCPLCHQPIQFHN